MTRMADELKRDLLADAYLPIKILDRGERGAITGTLNKHLGNDANRHAVLLWLFGVESSHLLSDGQWWAMWNWVGFWQDDGGNWLTNDDFPMEAMYAMLEATKSYLTQETVALGGKPSLLDAKTRTIINRFLEGGEL